MSNKIIDGIDVSKCEFYCSTAKFHKCDCLGGKARENSTVENLDCKENPNCYFKQLARAKEEIEKWKHQAELGSDTTDRLTKELQAKEQECEELKKALKSIKEIMDGSITDNKCFDN